MAIARANITGIKETITRLQQFAKKFRAKALRKAGNEATKAILPTLKQATPVGKKDYGGGSLKKSLGRKVSVKGDRLWFGVGPRTGWMREVAKKYRYFRDKQGRMRKVPASSMTWPPKNQMKDGSWRAGGNRFERPSRRAHFSEKRTRFISSTMTQTRGKTEAVLQAVLSEAMAEV